MQKNRLKRIFQYIVLLFWCFMLTQCCRIISVREMYPERLVITQNILTTYNIDHFHLQNLQFFLSQTVTLEQGVAHTYTYRNHGVQLKDQDRGNIVFDYDLEGRYVDHGIKREGFFLFAREKRFIKIFFGEPGMILEFEEDKKGWFRLATITDKKKQEYVQIGNNKFRILAGKEAYINIAASQETKNPRADFNVPGAPYEGERVCYPFPWEIVVIALGFLLLRQYSDF